MLLSLLHTLFLTTLFLLFPALSTALIEVNSTWSLPSSQISAVSRTFHFDSNGSVTFDITLFRPDLLMISSTTAWNEALLTSSEQADRARTLPSDEDLQPASSLQTWALIWRSITTFFSVSTFSVGSSQDLLPPLQKSHSKPVLPLFSSSALALPSAESVIRNYSVQVILCSHYELNALHLSDQLYQPSLPGTLCDEFSWNARDLACTVHTWLGQNSASMVSQWNVHFELTAPLLQADTYYLLINSCDGQAKSGLLTFIAQNSNGEYLSLSEVPYKSLYFISGAFWALLLIAWCIHLYRWRAFNIRLQVVMTLVLVSKIIDNLPLAWLWNTASRTGVFNFSLSLLSLVIDAVDLTIMFVVLVLMSKGYALLFSPSRVTTQEWRELSLYTVFLVVCYLSIRWQVQSFILPILAVGFILVLRFIFTSIITSTKALLDGVSSLLERNDDLDIATTPLWSKLQIFKVFQLTLLLYVCVFLVTSMWAEAIQRDTPWAYTTIIEATTFVATLIIGYTFSMRPFNPFYYYIVELYAKSDDVPSAPASAAVHPQQLSSLTNQERAVVEDRTRSRSAVSASAQRLEELNQSLLGDELQPEPVPQQMHYAQLPEIEVWRPGLPVPPFPPHPNAWLQNEDEEAAPLLVLAHPDGSVSIGHLVSDLPPSRIPVDALKYFPRQLVAILTKMDDEGVFRSAPLSRR